MCSQWSIKWRSLRSFTQTHTKSIYFLAYACIQLTAYSKLGTLNVIKNVMENATTNVDARSRVPKKVKNIFSNIKICIPKEIQDKNLLT